MRISPNPKLKTVVQMMNYCCGPFARSPEDLKSLADDMLLAANKMFEKNIQDARIVYLLERLSGGATVADKRAMVSEYATLIKQWRNLL